MRAGGFIASLGTHLLALPVLVGRDLAPVAVCSVTVSVRADTADERDSVREAADDRVLEFRRVRDAVRSGGEGTSGQHPRADLQAFGAVDLLAELGVRDGVTNSDSHCASRRGAQGSASAAMTTSPRSRSSISRDELFVDVARIECIAGGTRGSANAKPKVVR